MANTGFLPHSANPAAMPAAFCSAIPIERYCSGNSSAKESRKSERVTSHPKRITLGSVCAMARTSFAKPVRIALFSVTIIALLSLQLDPLPVALNCHNST